MKVFKNWKRFDYDSASVHLWVFKKSTTKAKFRAWHVKTDVEVEKLFRDAAKSETSRITEVKDYTHLSQNNESSCLRRPLEESSGAIALLQLVDAPEAENTVANLKEIKGSVGYLVKFRGKNWTVYAVKKAAPTWKPKVRNNLINAVFKNGELSAAPEESFVFESYFDFYCYKENIFMVSKRAYESTMSDKRVYVNNFDDLIVDNNFLSIFSDIDPLKKHVGSNAMHLRRMTVIQEKGLYKRPGFSERLKAVSEIREWGIDFDGNGKIVISEHTVRTIMQVLLDHRLLSEVTDTIYDVPDAEAV